MSWRHKSPGHQQPWYWHCFPRTFHPQHQWCVPLSQVIRTLTEFPVNILSRCHDHNMPVVLKVLCKGAYGTMQHISSPHHDIIIKTHWITFLQKIWYHQFEMKFCTWHHYASPPGNVKCCLHYIDWISIIVESKRKRFTLELCSIQ